MDLEDKFPLKVSGVQSPSSTAQSTPEKKGHSDDASRNPELLQEFLKSGRKKELIHPFSAKNKSSSSKRKMTEFRTIDKAMKKQESRKPSSSTHIQPSRKQSRKGENPMRFQITTEQQSSELNSNSWVCKNSACRAALSMDDSFCRRCSCSICHSYDDNKDPSLWLVCSSESGLEDSCGLSCHIECALRHKKVGVVDLGQLMQLDGSYCCSSCGKVSGILGCWKKQLIVAKEARRLDGLCYRIYLSYRLLEGTSRFKETHEIIKDAKAKLETEVGPLDGVSAKMARGIVSRLSVAADVQKLCSLAIEKADEWLANHASSGPRCREDSLPAACRLLFEEITPSSAIVILLEPSNASFNDIKGYKLWYCKSREKTFTKDPICVFPKTQRRILISDLKPCTEYTIRIVSYTEAGDLGHSEATCFTKSVEIIHKKPNSAACLNHNEKAPDEWCSSIEKTEAKTAIADGSCGFKVQDLGKALHLASSEEQGSLEGLCSADIHNCCGARVVKPEALKDRLPTGSHALDLNVSSVPDLNEELTLVFESSKDEYGCALEPTAEADDDAVSHGIDKKDLGRPHGIGDSHTWTQGLTKDTPAFDSWVDSCRKMLGNSNDEPHDSDSTLINGSPLGMSNASGSLDENFEYCVKIIRWLECEGHIDKEFRLRLLTWFSLRSTEQERRVINTFIEALIDDPSSLAGQLVDSFSETISRKRQRNGFCGKLYH